MIVAFGVEDEVLAEQLGLALRRLRLPVEAVRPIGATGYRLVNSLVLGNSSDTELLDRDGWLGLLVDGEAPPSNVRRPMVSSFSGARGTLDSEIEVLVLFIQINSMIEGNYRMRADYQRALAEFEEN